MTAAVITDAMVTAAAEILWAEAEAPYRAYCRDFTTEQVLAGELRAADLAADRQNNDLVRRALQAAFEAKPQ